MMTRRTVLAALACAVAVRPSAAQTPAPEGASELVIHKEGTTLYHRAGCPVVADMKDVLAMTRGQAESRKLTPHADCDPANPKATVKGGRAQVTVYVDGGRHYHRKECKRLNAKEAKAAPLEEAGRKFWPCPECKPPRRERRGDDVPLGPQRRGRG